MKELFFVLMTFVTLFCIGQNKSGVAYYTKESKLNNEKLNNSDVKEELKKAISNVNETIGSNEYVLKFNPNFAKYQLVEKMNSDENSSFKNKLALAFSGFNGVAFFDKKIGHLIIKKEILDETFLIITKFEEMNWILTKEKLILNGLTCYKAKKVLIKEGRNGVIETEITVWYTPEINLPYGPDGFGGLPGLIIQLENGNIVTTLDKIEFVDKEIKITLPTKGKKLTEGEFNAFMKDFSMNREKYINKN